MLNAGIEGFGRRVLREAGDVPASDASQPTGPGDEQEAQGPHATQDVGVRALAGASSWGCEGIELEAPGDVVGEDAELLPGTVGPVMAGRDHVDEGARRPERRCEHHSRGYDTAMYPRNSCNSPAVFVTLTPSATLGRHSSRSEVWRKMA